jgi:hypothetical protein
MNEEITFGASDIIIERLKNDLTFMIQDTDGSSKNELVDSMAETLRYYMQEQESEAFFSSIGYMKNIPLQRGNSIEILDIKDNPDGSADLTFSFSDEKLKKILIEEGMNYILIKNALGLSTEKILELVQKNSK